MKLIYFLIFTKMLFSQTLKISTLAPKGTTWATNLKKLSKEVRAKTNGEVKFKIYYGGVQGDEPDVLRKVRLGQLHGAVFTGRALGDIFSDVRVMEVPFNFHNDRKKAQKTLKALTPYFDKGFENNGFKNLSFIEIGKIYLVSKKKISNLNELKGIKIWSWEGDPLASALVEHMHLVSVPLALPDVLSSLSTGIIDAAYSSPMGILALQWNSKIRYLVNYPITYSIGAFLVSLNQWQKLSEENQKIVQALVQSYMEKNSDETIVENEKALQALSSVGVEKIDFPKEDLERGDEINKNLYSILAKKKVLTPSVIKLYKGVH